MGSVKVRWLGKHEFNALFCLVTGSIAVIDGRQYWGMEIANGFG